MSETNEVLLTSSQSSDQWSVCMWDYTSGNALQIYRNGGIAASKCLELLGNDFVFTAEQGKPILHAWPVNSQDQAKDLRLILPESANCLSVCPHNCYLAVGISSKLYVWQLSSGKLLNVQQKHFQSITNVKFSSCGDFLLVAGQDGMLVAYNFANIVNMQSNLLPQSIVGQVEPMYTKLDHSMPITDIYVGKFGAKSRFATISSDQTCRMYSLYNGEPLLTLIFTEPLTSVIFDAPCWNLYIGCNSGLIRHFNLINPPRTIEHHADENEPEAKLVGHVKKVTCLSLNLSANVLASGSEDFSVLLWEVHTRQILRRMEHKSPITNVRFALSCGNMKVQSFVPQICIKKLERSLQLEDSKFEVSIMQNEDTVFSDQEAEDGELGVEKIDAMAVEIDRLKRINKQLYQTNLNLIETLNKN